jgi:hypothetical protein
MGRGVFFDFYIWFFDFFSTLTPQPRPGPPKKYNQFLSFYIFFVSNPPHQCAIIY